MYGHDIIIETPPYVFGDGKHETTLFLLYFLNRYGKGKTVIDAGCGSGILSIFAYKIGCKVTAIDSDPIAVETALKNFEANSVDADVIHAYVDQIDLKADIVTANFARYEAQYLLPHVSKMADIIITTWYKEMSTEPLKGYEILDYIEGIDYDCYVLKKEQI